MRIVSGEFRGKAITTPAGDKTRPTSDRARQAVFNILEHAAWSPGVRDLRVIDVRDDGEFEVEGHIPGASHLYVGYVERELDRLRPSFDADAPMVVTCGVGHRASLAASMLLRRGARDVRNLLGGMDAWKKLDRRMDVGASELSVTTPEVEGPRQ